MKDAVEWLEDIDKAKVFFKRKTGMEFQFRVAGYWL